MIQDLITEYGVLTQKLADQDNQLFTAALQHGNDQQAIGDLKAKVADLNTQLHDETTLAVGLEAQLAQLQSTVTYGNLEYGLWQLNPHPDEASGRGTATFTPAQDPNTPALFSITPDAPLAGDKDNFFNAYATQKKKPNAAATSFVLAGKWEFLTDADVKAAHCIEMEARQVLPKTSALLLPLMGVPAFQMNFSGNMFRYFNALAPGDNWIPTGIPMPRQRTVAVVMEAHRDDKTLFYDAFTINGTRHAVSFQAPLYAKTYVNERMSVSLQLDSHYLAGPFKVIPSGVELKVW